MIRVERELPVEAAEGFDRFCDVEQLPRWVPEVSRVEVLGRHPDGRVSNVRFTAHRVNDVEHSYALTYAYDPRGRRVMWTPAVGETAGLKGFAQFEVVDEGICRVLYVLDLSGLDEATKAASSELAEGTVEAFASYLGAT